MRLSIKARQVATVVLLVGLSVTLLSAIYLTWLARVHLRESLSRGEMVSRFVYERAGRVITSPENAYTELKGDRGLRALLESSIAYSKHVTYSAIVDPSNVIVVHSSPSLEGQTLEPQTLLSSLIDARPWQQIPAISSDRIFEVQQVLLLQPRPQSRAQQFGSIRVGVSTTLIWSDVLEALKPAAWTALASLAVSTLVALLLAQWTLRPVHVLKSGLTRLGRGEFDVKLDLPPGDEFGELGDSFNLLSAALSEVRSQLATGQAAPVESVVDRLEDAVAMFNPEGELLFANAALRKAFPDSGRGAALPSWPELHPYRLLVERALSTRKSQGPVSRSVSLADDRGDTEQWLMAHALEHADRRFLGVMLVARDLGYLGQVQSTLRYSRKAASLGRLLAGVAHEVKNPLNAMTIHLELLKQKLGGTTGKTATQVTSTHETVGGRATALATPESVAKAVVDVPAVMKHVGIIGSEIRRLDEVVQGFLKFSRPEELSLEPLELRSLVADVGEVVEPQACDAGVRLLNECAPELARINGDRTMLRQALLNLTLNAVQAMPSGGALRFSTRTTSDRRLALVVEDTGVGIPPEHLSRVFDLYFTTKDAGSGIGLSMVYRTIQLHDGDIEVQSTPGRGTTFTLYFPQA